MNRLSLGDRVRVLAALVEGNSIRGTARMVGVDKKTVLRLLADVGDACDLYLDQTMRGVKSERLQLDEIWSFCYARDRNLPVEMRGADGVGDLWTWTALDADTKLIVTWHLGKRTRGDAALFVRDLSARIASECVQITSDGLGHYYEPIRRYFENRADYGTEIKDYGMEDAADRKYSPMVVKSIIRTPLYGVPDPAHISTAYVERNNLTMRMSMRRFTRLTNAFSKKAVNLHWSLALHFMHYNFCRKRQTIKTTPAMAAGLTNRLWTLHDLARLPDRMDGSAAA